MPDSPLIDLADTATLPPSGIPNECAPVPTNEVPGYEILAELGRGGMGVIYKARQTSLNRTVALKMILGGGHASPADRERFRAEALAVARLQHPNIVQVHEVGEHRGQLFFSLEFCDGGSLDQRLDGTPWKSFEAAALVETLARAVQHAHEQGIIHRDLKPANILIADCGLRIADTQTAEQASSTEGAPDPQSAIRIPQPAMKIADFGLAKSFDGTSGRTATGAILGTPSYMAPEQADDSRKVGPWTDVYSLGAVLYELLTGRPPFRAATPLDTILQVVNDEAVSPARLNWVPVDLNTICLKCLHKESAKRYPSAKALADDLRRFQNNAPITARPISVVGRIVKWAKRRPAVAALSAISVLAVVGGFTGVLWQLDQANAAKTDAEIQTGIAKQMAYFSKLEHKRAQRELHQSDLLRADLLMQTQDFAKAEELLWRVHFTRPDDDDQRAYWRLWDLYRQRPKKSGWWAGAAGGSVRFSLDGRRAVHVNGAHVTVHDSVTGVVQAQSEVPEAVSDSATFSWDGNRLSVVSGTDGSAFVWDIEPELKLKAQLRPVARPSRSLSMALGGALNRYPPELLARGEKMLAMNAIRVCLLDGDRALVCDAQRAVVWNLNSPSVITQLDLPAPPQSMPGVTRSWNGGSAGFGGSIAGFAGDHVAIDCDGVIRLWDIPRQAGTPIVSTRLDFSDPKAFRRVTESDQGKKPQAQNAAAPVISLRAVSGDGKWLVTADRKKVHVWDLASGSRIAESDLPETWLTFAISADGSTLCARGEKIHCWRMPNLESIATVSVLGLANAYGRSPGVSRDGQDVFLADHGAVGLYQREASEPIRWFEPPTPPKGLRDWQLGPSGPAVVRDQDEIRIVGDGAPGRIRRQSSFVPFNRPFLATPAGTLAIEIEPGFFSTTLTTYDLKQRRKVRSVSVTRTNSPPMVFDSLDAVSPDGTKLAVCTAQAISIYDLATLTVVQQIPNPRPTHHQINGIHWSPNNERLLAELFSFDDAAPPDGDAIELVLLSMADGHELASTRLTPRELFIDFTPNDEYLFTAGNGNLILRDGSNLTKVAEISAAPEVGYAHAFSPDGNVLAIGEKTKLRLWDFNARREITSLDLFPSDVLKLVFAPDGRKLRFVTTDGAGEIDLHAFDPYIAGNLGWNLERLLPELFKSGSQALAQSVLDRVKATDSEAYRKGRAALEALVKP